MPHPLRSDVSGTIYHALNRGNARNDIFFKQADDEAFERVIADNSAIRGWYLIPVYCSCKMAMNEGISANSTVPLQSQSASPWKVPACKTAINGPISV